MTTITATDLATIRRRSGDVTVPYDLQDADIDAIYTSTAYGNLNLDRTTYFVIRECYGVAVRSIAISNPMGGITRNQKYEQYERLLAFWGTKVTGLSDQLLADAITGGGFAAPADDWVEPANWSPQE